SGACLCEDPKASKNSILKLAAWVIGVAAVVGGVISTVFQLTAKRAAKLKKAQIERAKNLPTDEKPAEIDYTVIDFFVELVQDRDWILVLLTFFLTFFWNSMLGVAAASMTSLFLKIVSSDLLKQANEGDNVQLLVFFGFCLVASLSAQRFIAL